ncbi:hypothetical protein [Mesorhizobium sp. M00.F.Ca.ET.216.01.1.1]|uniref:hypothetical protein n=1 Tax=Mesorhizobium sp. M00.F.Ca.ET.216.01.1.1 TaxID=2500528 RepID=UPI000FDAAA2C|nr:hypothetical protein [Mesorhizobium sp. M00.F.Ca.ET.216.01.1.1]TGQ30878.1 hypothetical protein EN859_031185 [Mesorhizobium sp. M00.F.Ca.ET.216.01.1.1]
MIDEAVNDVLDSPPVKTKPRMAQSLSLWRLHSLLRPAILNAILMMLRPASISARFTEIIRHSAIRQDGAKANPLQQG